jgi:hypothetical protein
MSDTYVQTAYLRGQLRAAHEAIADIWVASQDTNQTEMQRAATLDQVIYHATELLPQELRTDKMPEPAGGTSEKMEQALKAARNSRPPAIAKRVDEIEDLLG